MRGGGGEEEQAKKRRSNESRHAPRKSAIAACAVVSGVIPLRAYLRPQSDFALGAYSKGSVATRFQTNGISRRIASRWTGSFIVCGVWGQCVRVRSGVRERRWVGGVSGRKATSARGKGITGTIRYNYSTASQNEEQRRQERERDMVG